MVTSRRFQDLDAWRAARVLGGTVYAASSSGKFSRDFSLKEQIRRSAISVMSNIAEGFERESNRKFLQFLALAKGSCGEVRAQLFIALDQAYIRKDEFQSLCQKAGRRPALFIP